MTTSWRAEKCSSGSSSRSSIPDGGMVFSSIAASAGWSGHGSWWISARFKPSCVLRIEAVALGQEVGQRARIGVDDVADRPVGHPKRRPLTAAPPALVLQPAVSPLGPHLGAEVRELVDAPRRLDGEVALGIEAEEPDPGLSAGRDVRTGVDLEKGRDQRQRRQPARSQPGDAKRRDADPCLVLEEIELEPLREVRPERVGGRPPVREQQLVPGLAHHPRRLGQRPRPVIGLLQRGRLPGRRLHGVQEAPGECAERTAPRAAQRLPRRACSLSIDSKSALKLPSPKVVAPWRSMTSKNTVGRSWAVFVKIWSR